MNSIGGHAYLRTSDLFVVVIKFQRFTTNKWLNDSIIISCMIYSCHITDYLYESLLKVDARPLNLNRIFSVRKVNIFTNRKVTIFLFFLIILSLFLYIY